MAGRLAKGVWTQDAAADVVGIGGAVAGGVGAGNEPVGLVVDIAGLAAVRTDAGDTAAKVVDHMHHHAGGLAGRARRWACRLDHAVFRVARAQRCASRVDGVDDAAAFVMAVLPSAVDAVAEGACLLEMVLGVVAPLQGDAGGRGGPGWWCKKLGRFC